MKNDSISHVIAGLLLAISFSPILVHAQAPAAQQQTQSLADAARKAREQNKNRPSGKVITNEDIPNIKGTVSVVGTPPPQPAPTQPNAEDSAPNTATPAGAAPGGEKAAGAAAKSE